MNGLDLSRNNSLNSQSNQLTSICFNPTIRIKIIQNYFFIQKSKKYKSHFCGPHMPIYRHLKKLHQQKEIIIPIPYVLYILSAHKKY